MKADQDFTLSFMLLWKHHNSFQNLSVALRICYVFLFGCFLMVVSTKSTCTPSKQCTLAASSSSSGQNSLTHTLFSASSPCNVAIVACSTLLPKHPAQLSCKQVELLSSPQLENISLTKTNTKPNEPFGFQKTDPQATRTIHAN